MTNIASRLRDESHSRRWYEERLEYMSRFLTDERREVLRRPHAARAT